MSRMDARDIERPVRFGLITVLAVVGLVWDLREPTPAVVESNRVAHGRAA